MKKMKSIITGTFLLLFVAMSAKGQAKPKPIDTLDVIWFNKCDTIPGGITTQNNLHCGKAVRLEGHVILIIDCQTKRRVVDSCGIKYLY